MICILGPFSKRDRLSVVLLYVNESKGEKEDLEESKNIEGHVLFGSAVKWSFRGTGCSRSGGQSTAGRSLDKPKVSPL